jgi:hypothetical protein
MNALYALMACVHHGFVVIKLTGLLYLGWFLTIGTFFLPSEIVLFSLHHVNDALSEKVVNIMLSGWLSFLNISLAVCCGLNNLMGNCGTR